MLREAAEYLVSLGERKVPVEQLEFGGRKYTNRTLNKVEEPLRTAIQVSTLSGLADLLASDCQFEEFTTEKHLVHVVSHLKVQVVTKKSNHWKNREALVECIPTDTKGFKFDEFQGHEAFVIGLMSSFAETDDREKVLKIASNVTSEAVVTSTDDGVSQSVGVKQGVHLQGTVTIRTVKLAPYRTFREVGQPVSDFILRARQDNEGQIPKLALFEADGGKWKLEAVENVARHLRTLLPEKTVVVS